MEKKAKEAKAFLPEVTLSLDGYGGSNPRKTCGEKLKDIMEKEGVPVKNNPTIHAKRFVKRGESKNVAGGVTVIHAPGQERVKAELTEQVVSMPSFRKMAVKRKVDLEEFSEENLKRKCTRRSPQQELFGDAWNEHLDEAHPWSKLPEF